MDSDADMVDEPLGVGLRTWLGRKLFQRIHKFRDAGAIDGDCPEYWGAVALRRKGKHRLQLVNSLLYARPVRLIDNEDIGDLHHACFDRLNVVTHAGHKDYQRGVGRSRDVDLVLSALLSPR